MKKQFYRVKPQFDGQPLFKPSAKGRRIPNGYTLMRYELLSEKEVTRLNVPSEMVAKVEVEDAEIFHMYNKRFEAGALSRK